VGARLRLAFVGCGAIARWHWNSLRGAADRTDVTAVIDIDPSRAATMAQETDAEAFPSLGDALAADAFDAALVMVPHHVHEKAAITLLEAEKHVLLEKPIAPTLDAAERILSRAASSGAHFQVGENAQYWPEITAVAEAIERGAIGDVITARAWHCHPPMADFYGGEAPWRFSQAAAGGGVTIDTGSHWLRPLRRWCGELTEVLAVTARPFAAMEGESMCRALCRFDTGVVASFDVLLVPWAAAPVPPFQITGSGGELVVEAFGAVRLFDGSDPEGVVIAKGNYFQSYASQLIDFESAVLDGQSPAASAEYALGELRGALAMYRSAESGHWERVW
jgi:UDP-N-acetyl-2-amino-2-deoxyglucuronate dehydrogenase